MSQSEIPLQKALEDVEKKKVPRRIIHFVSGETMEEYSTDEEEGEEEEEQVDFYSVDTAAMSWIRYIQFWILRIATTAFLTCDFLGGKLATLFGLNVPKYQYVVDEYNRMQDEGSDDEDGEDVTKTREINVLDEKIHLEAQSTAYGSIHPPADGSQHGGNCIEMSTKPEDSMPSGK